MKRQLTEGEKEAKHEADRAKYLKGCSQEKLKEIAGHAVVLGKRSKCADCPGYCYTDKEISNNLELAIHQQRTLDWMEAHPRKENHEIQVDK